MRQTYTYGAIALVVALFLLPFIVMLMTSFKPPTEVLDLPPRLLPDDWVLDNYAQALDAIPIARYFFNTLVIAVGSVIGTLVSCPLVGYALAKLSWRGRGFVFALVVGTMMLPPQVTFIPLYLVFDRLGLTGTFVPLILPTFFGTPFFIFLMRQFFTSVPNELMEAARIDGASELRIYWGIVLPLARPALATIGVFQFMWSWTDFLNPLIYLNNESLYTLSLGLYGFFSSTAIAWGPLMAASVAFTVPALLVFLFGQRFFLGGIATTGLK
jgi:multiple sugar transport system permease protein